MDVTWILAGALASIVLWKIYSGNRQRRLINKIPGPTAYPLIGNLLDLIIPTSKVIARSLERRRKYGKIVRLWMGTNPIVAISGPEYIEVILSSNKEIKKSFMYRLVASWLGQGLLTSTGERWFKHRKMITPTFHFKILDSFIPIFESNSQVLARKLGETMKTDAPFDIYPFITKCALDIICETAMGINLHAQEAEQSEYITAVYRVSRLIAERGMRVYEHSDFIYGLTAAGKEYKKCVQSLHYFTQKVISERKELRKSSKANKLTTDDFGVKKKTAFLDLLLDQENDLTDVDLREEVDTFMFEGHDTTTAGISWSLYLLGLHPAIQDQVFEEICDVWPQHEPLNMQHLNDMKLLERVIKESLRIYPSVPFISRHIDNDLQLGEYLVPMGTTVSVLIAGLHKDEEVFPEPEKFDPDRFLPENVQKRHPYAYVPFSAGPRNCIGQKFALFEEKAVLASVIREFKLNSLDKREEVSCVADLIMRPEHGIRMKITPRPRT